MTGIIVTGCLREAPDFALRRRRASVPRSRGD